MEREEDVPALRELYERGKENGVPGLHIISANEVREMEPNVSVHVPAAIHAPNGSIVCLFGFTMSLVRIMTSSVKVSNGNIARTSVKTA